MTRAVPLLNTPKQTKWRKLLQQLDLRCVQPIDDFRKLGTVTESIDGPLIYIDRGSPILGVAHMDTMAWLKDKKQPVWFNSRKGEMPIIQTIQLDDRLGVWMLLDLLPAMGLTFDVLLCDSEERGCSTAENFKPGKEYNWGFEFDRAGIDTVLYDYEDSDTWTADLKKAGFDIGIGSFSDISCLTHVGCCFANFGVGYRQQHTDYCHAYLDDTILMAMEFESWYKAKHDVRYPYTHVERSYYTPRYRSTWKWMDKRTPASCTTITITGSKDTPAAYEEEYPIRCPWCQGTEWDDDGVCLICGFDSYLDQMGEDDKYGERTCQWCGDCLPANSNSLVCESCADELAILQGDTV